MTDLEKRRVKDFIIDYAEAVEEAKKHAEQQRSNAAAKRSRAKRRR